MNSSRVPFAIVVALAAAACSASDPPSRAQSPEPSVTPDSGAPVASRVLAAEVAVYTDLCKCPAAFGQPDSATCFKHFVARTPPQADCVRALFEAHAAELDVILECEIQVVASVQACLGPVSNCEPNAVLACAASGQTANTACGTYPDAVRRGIDECYGVDGGTP
jgi:hypothetical protein